MAVLDSKVHLRDKILLSAGGLSIGALCLFAFVFLLSATHTIAVLVSSSVTAVLAVVLIPLIYDKINSSIAVSTGRYHLMMVVVTILAPLTFVAFFAIDNNVSVAARGVVFSLLLPVVVISGLVSLYMFNSIKERVIRREDKHFSIFFVIMSFGSVLAFFLSVILQRIPPSGISSLTNFIPTAAFVAGILVLISGICVYFGSVNYMPRFIRLEPPKGRTVKEKYGNFYKPFLNRQNIHSSLAYFCAMTAFLLLTLNALVSSFGTQYFAFYLGAFLLSFVTVTFLAEKVIVNRNMFLFSVWGALAFILSAVMSTLPYASSLTAFWARFIPLFAGLAAGVGGAIAMAFRGYNAQEISLNAGVSKGVAHNFYNISVAVAFFAALGISLFALIFSVLKNWSDWVVPVTITHRLIVSIAASAFAIAFSVLSIFSRKKDELVMKEIDLTIEDEIVHDIDEEASVVGIAYDEFIESEEEIEQG